MVEIIDASRAAVSTVRKNEEPGKLLLQFLSAVIIVAALDGVFSRIMSTVLITFEDGSANPATLAWAG